LTHHRKDRYLADNKNSPPGACFVAAVSNSVEFATDDSAPQGKMTISFMLTAADGGTACLVVHDRLPPGLSPADNELGWRSSLAKRAALVETDARGRAAATPSQRARIPPASE
jgi:hypothetical protein